MKRQRAKLCVEHLEDRCVPATWGNPWPDATHLTLSFAPDGTAIGSHSSNLFETFNALAPTKTWETEILRAVQTWAAQSNINVALAADNGLPFGSPGAIQSDPRFGDIRVGAYAMPPGAIATASPFEPEAGTWSGDVLLNSAASFGMNGSGQYDLFSVMLHEAGHVFGFGDVNNPDSIENFHYLGVSKGLGSTDICGLQSLYGGARSLAQGDSHSRFAQAISLNSLGNALGATSMTADGDISTLQDRDTYSFNSLLSLGGADITVRTAGISLLTPRVTIYDTGRHAIFTTATTDPAQGGFVIHLSNLSPLSTYYVAVQSGQQNVFGIGSYELTVSALPLVNGLLGGVKATVTQGVGAVNDVLINRNPWHTNRSLATATPLSPNWSGSGGSSYFTYRGSLNGVSDADYFWLQAPASGAAGVLTAMVWGLENNTDPHVRIFDAQHHLLDAQVLVNDGFTYVLQIPNTAPGATYYVEVLPADASTKKPSAGNFCLYVNFGGTGASLANEVSGTLTGSQPKRVDSFQFSQRSEFFHFVLSASPSGPSDQSIQMNIVNALGHTVFTLRAGSAEPMTGNVILDPGMYTVVSTATSASNSTLIPMGFQLLGETLTDPEGPQPSDPTGDPSGSPNTTLTDQQTWTNSTSAGVPPQNPASNPYSTVTLYSPGDQVNLGGDGVSLALSASDTTNDSLVFSATGLPNGLTIDSNTGIISGTIANNAASSSPAVVTVTATDNGNGCTANQTFNWTVNLPVVTLYNPGDPTNLAGDTVLVNVSASSSDHYPLNFTATGLPPGLSIDPNSGTISGTISNNAANGTPYSVNVSATDSSSGVSATQAFQWTVNPPVVSLTSPGDQTNVARDAVSLTVSASVSDSYALTYSAAGLPPGLTIDPNTGKISGTIGTDAASANPYVVTITALDSSSGASDTITINWTVNLAV